MVTGSGSKSIPIASQAVMGPHPALVGV